MGTEGLEATIPSLPAATGMGLDHGGAGRAPPRMTGERGLGCPCRSGRSQPQRGMGHSPVESVMEPSGSTMCGHWGLTPGLCQDPLQLA